MELFKQGIKYRFEMRINQTFTKLLTGYVIEEDENFFKIKTIMDETMVLNKKDLIQAKEEL